MSSLSEVVLWIILIFRSKFMLVFLRLVWNVLSISLMVGKFCTLVKLVLCILSRKWFISWNGLVLYTLVSIGVWWVMGSILCVIFIMIVLALL